MAHIDRCEMCRFYSRHPSAIAGRLRATREISALPPVQLRRFESDRDRKNTDRNLP